MDFFDVISLLGGLALFLFGMSVLSNSLEKASEGRLERILATLTANVPKAVLFGALITAAIQSSSATTVVVVGLVNAKILKLKQAIGIIMGANIGTTITSHIFSLTDLSSSNPLVLLFKPSTLAPLMATIGIALYLISKKDKIRDVGNMLLGFGVLFSGMFQMEAAVYPLRDLPEFAELFSSMSNPVLGVLVGATVTALIQSSSASVGILQSLSSTGLITCASAYPIILGQNIGTCVTPMLASIGASKGAKRAAIIHVCFNIIGTTVFLIALYGYQYAIGFEFWNDPIDKTGIALFHSVFNIGVTVIFLPFVSLLDKLTYKFIPEDDQENEIADVLSGLDERLLVSPGLAIDHAEQAVLHMANIAKENFGYASQIMLSEYNSKLAEKIQANENMIDTLQDRIENYAVQISRRHITENHKIKVTQLLHMIVEFERIGDQCENILEASQKKTQAYSPNAQKELRNIFTAVDEILDLVVSDFQNHSYNNVEKIEPLEQVIDLLEEQLKNRHVARLRDGDCSLDGAFSFVEAINALERVSDHCSNIAIFMLAVKEGYYDFDSHAYTHSLHRGESTVYQDFYKEFEKKYINA